MEVIFSMFNRLTALISRVIQADVFGANARSRAESRAKKSLKLKTHLKTISYR